MRWKTRKSKLAEVEEKAREYEKEAFYNSERAASAMRESSLLCSELKKEQTRTEELTRELNMAKEQLRMYKILISGIRQMVGGSQ